MVQGVVMEPGAAAAAMRLWRDATWPVGAVGWCRLSWRHLLPDGPGADPVARLAAAVHARPPLALAELAPLVSQAAAAGDPMAVEVVREAASRLVATLRRCTRLRARGAGRERAHQRGPVREAVIRLLASGTAHEVATAGDAAGAAAWLAARPFLGPDESRARHQRFVHPAAARRTA
ncbi:hypothetical protein GCM10020220_011480 [Nonomuraea rubra]|uniref:hypothetical protein n=1 Tax=Nonomuraea rubra TaxID=46180 RepID=UPI0031F13E83